MAPQVNGNVAHSAFFDHLLQYPLVNDSVKTVQQNKIGQHGIAISNSAYQTFAKPVVPYLARPYEFVQPYVKAADDIGEKALATLDNHFPVVKKPTGELYQDTKSVITLPYRRASESKDHVFHVYSDERKQINGDGLFPFAKALFATGIVVTTHTLMWVKDIVGSAKQQAQQQVQEKAN